MTVYGCVVRLALFIITCMYSFRNHTCSSNLSPISLVFRISSEYSSALAFASIVAWLRLIILLLMESIVVVVLFYNHQWSLCLSDETTFNTKVLVGVVQNTEQIDTETRVLVASFMVKLKMLGNDWLHEIEEGHTRPQSFPAPQITS